MSRLFECRPGQVDPGLLPPAQRGPSVSDQGQVPVRQQLQVLQGHHASLGYEKKVQAQKAVIVLKHASEAMQPTLNKPSGGGGGIDEGVKDTDATHKRWCCISIANSLRCLAEA